ncbi:MAG: hypothetical protein IPI06_14250 [Gammaproteobacteria bacterium]|nr:hypothetical protein [Gammaproteobacteria bacterium]
MSSSDRLRTEPVARTGAADPYASWLDRMQRGRGRHAAITKNLNTWSNYKSWADRIKGSWTDQGESGTSKK